MQPKNDWQLEEFESYSRTRFYTKASDNKGHREEIRVKVPPHIYDAIGRIVRSDGKGPIPEYRTMSDFVRDAIVHRLHDLWELGMVQGIEDALRQHLAMEAILEYHERESMYSSFIERSKPIISSLLGEGTPAALQEAKRMVREFYIHAMNMTDSPYWQEKYMSFLKRNFPKIIQEIESE